MRSRWRMRMKIRVEEVVWLRLGNWKKQDAVGWSRIKQQRRGESRVEQNKEKEDRIGWDRIGQDRKGWDGMGREGKDKGSNNQARKGKERKGKEHQNYCNIILPLSTHLCVHVCVTYVYVCACHHLESATVETPLLSYLFTFRCSSFLLSLTFK